MLRLQRRERGRGGLFRAELPLVSVYALPEGETKEGIHSNHGRKGQDWREIEEGQECRFFGLNCYVL